MDRQYRVLLYLQHQGGTGEEWIRCFLWPDEDNLRLGWLTRPPSVSDCESEEFMKGRPVEDRAIMPSLDIIYLREEPAFVSCRETTRFSRQQRGPQMMLASSRSPTSEDAPVSWPSGILASRRIFVRAPLY